MKCCSRCGVTLPLDQFFRNSSSPDGRYSRCKECHQAAMYDSCPDCGERKWSRAARCRRCASRVIAEPSTPETGRAQARRLYPELGACEHTGCDAPATDRHHIDGNPRNNAAENIARLCRRHHMQVDGRLAALAEQSADAGRSRPSAETRARMSAARRAWWARQRAEAA